MSKKKIELTKEPAVGDAVHFHEAGTGPKAKQQVHASAASVVEVHDALTGDCTLSVCSPYSAEPVSVRALFGADAGTWSYPAEGG